MLSAAERLFVQTDGKVAGKPKVLEDGTVDPSGARGPMREPSAPYRKMLMRNIRRAMLQGAQDVDDLRNSKIFRHEALDLFPIDKLTAELGAEKWNKLLDERDAEEARYLKIRKAQKTPEPAVDPNIDVNFEEFFQKAEKTDGDKKK